MARYISTGIGICTLCCCWLVVVACLWSMIFSSKTVTNQLQSKTWPGSAQQQHDLIRDFKTIFSSLRLFSTLFFFLLFVFSRARCVLSSLRGINEWIRLAWRGSIFFSTLFLFTLLIFTNFGFFDCVQWSNTSSGFLKPQHFVAGNPRVVQTAKKKRNVKKTKKWKRRGKRREARNPFENWKHTQTTFYFLLEENMCAPERIAVAWRERSPSALTSDGISCERTTSIYKKKCELNSNGWMDDDGQIALKVLFQELETWWPSPSGISWMMFRLIPKRAF